MILIYNKYRENQNKIMNLLLMNVTLINQPKWMIILHLRQKSIIILI